MKKRKKYNPLKKYQKGGSTTAAIQAGVASAEKEDQPENLMLGRTYIPRMSEATRDEVIAAGRKAIEKIRDKRAAKKLKKEEEAGMTEDVSKKDMRKEKREEKRFMREADRFFAKTKREEKREEKRKSKKRPKNVRGLLRGLKKIPVRDDVFMPTANITTKKAKR